MESTGCTWAQFEPQQKVWTLFLNERLYLYLLVAISLRLFRGRKLQEAGRSFWQPSTNSDNSPEVGCPLETGTLRTKDGPGCCYWIMVCPHLRRSLQRSCTLSHQDHPFHWCLWDHPFGCPTLLARPGPFWFLALPQTHGPCAENATRIEKTWSRQWMKSLPSWKKKDDFWECFKKLRLVVIMWSRE